MDTASAPRQAPSRTGVWLQISGGAVEVSCPWNPDYVEGARDLEGRWNPATRTWRFPAELADHVRLLLTDVFLTDGLPAPGVDILLALDDYCAGRSACSAMEIGGRWAVSSRPGHARDYTMDAFTDLAHGDFAVQDGQLIWKPGTVLHIECLPEAVVDNLPEPQRAAVYVLRRHGLDLASVHRSVAALERELTMLRQVIEREQDRPAGLLPGVENDLGAAGEPRWRLRSRDGAGGRRLIVPLDGCMAAPPLRILARSEVLDLAARGAHLCNRCGAAAAARDHATSTSPGTVVPRPQKARLPVQP